MDGGLDHLRKFGDSFRDRRVCVTGGAGFIGGHLVEALVSLGAHVRVIDDLSSSSIDHIAGVVERTPERVRFLYASILEDGALREAVEHCEVVFHLAAMGSVPRSLEEPERCMSVNTTGTVRVLEAARRAGVLRVVFASSSSVYGVGDPAHPRVARVESDPPDPLSPYAASKIAGEHVVRAWSRSMGIDGVSLRYFNVFGPRQPADSAYAAVIPAFVRALREGRPGTIYGDGSFSRDFTPVANVVDANLLAARAEGPLLGAGVNIGLGDRMTILELHRSLAELLGRPDVEPEFRPARAGDVPHSLADISAARALIGYEPVVAAQAGLEALVHQQDGDEGERPNVIFRIA
jgi:nucleoside-diphosphate-sugar epimerase